MLSHDTLPPPKKLPLAKELGELVLSNYALGNFATIGVNTILGTAGVKVPTEIGKFLGGFSVYLNGRGVPGTLGLYLTTPQISRKEVAEMVARGAGFLGALATSAAFLAVDSFVTVDGENADEENPLIDTVIRGSIATTVGTAVEYGARWGLNKLSFFAPKSNPVIFPTEEDPLINDTVNTREFNA